MREGNSPGPGRLRDGESYRAYLLFLLATVLVFNGLDSAALGLVLQNIKEALHLSDTELGVLTGIAFSLFYSTVGIPIGRWADRGDRALLIALSTALWGIMVMLIGAVRSFGDLLIVRIGVAVGEAGCTPAAYSLIADYFRRDERPRAVATYWLGGSVSVIVGYIAAGWLDHHYGWRTMFVCLGAPSLVVALLTWFTLAEPRRMRTQSADGATERVEIPGILRVIEVLWQNRTFRYLLGMQCVLYFFGSGLGVWQASFFVRSYGMTTEWLGLYFAIAYGAGGIIGTYAGGYLASRYAPKNERLQFRILAVTEMAFGLVSALIYLSREPFVSLALLGLSFVGGTLQAGPVFATIQTVIPEGMRGISISVVFLFANLFGAGLGPVLVGALSDGLRLHFGVEALRYALLSMCPGYLLASWLCWKTARTVVADTQSAEHASGPSRATGALDEAVPSAPAEEDVTTFLDRL